MSASADTSSAAVSYGDYVLLVNYKDYPEHAYALLQGLFLDGQQAADADALASAVQQQTGLSIDKNSVQCPAGLSGHAVVQAQAVNNKAANTASGLQLLQGQALQCAKEVRLKDHEVQAVLGSLPPQLTPDQSSIANAQWFHKRWLIAQSQGKVSCSTFRLFPGQDGRLRNAFNAWLDQAKSESAIDQVADCEIETGVFKYVLLVVTDLNKGQSKLIVRGDRQSGYHMDVFEKTVRDLQPLNLHVAQPLGGGRIRHDDGSKAITIYGYSSAYGQAPHDLSAAIVRQWYPTYAADKITVSYEGY